MNCDDISVSIIVPVYNVEKYLERCIESLLKQTYSKIEIILVDDGSPDNCPAICDKYASNYANVISLHKSNGGLSSARNYGVQNANNQWIVFVDSDDYVENTYVEDMISLKNKYNADFVITRTSRENENGSGKINLHFDDFCVNNKEALFYVYSQTKVGWAAYGKLYPKNVLLKFPFPDGYFEDCACMYLIINNFNKIAIGSHCNNYHYIQHDGSILISHLNKKHYRIFEICNEFDIFLNQYGNDSLILSVLMKYHAVVQLLTLQKMSWIEYKKIFYKYNSFFRKNLMLFITDKRIQKMKKIYFFILCTRPELFALFKKVVANIKK